MAYDPRKLATIQTLKDTVARIKKEYLAAISKAGHASFQQVSELPSVAEAQNNVLYLLMNAETGHYDIYVKIGETMQWLDDITVNLEGYATLEDLENAVGATGNVFSATKTDLGISDSDIIAAYFTEHTDAVPKKGDVFVIDTLVETVDYEQSSYSYTGTQWVAMTGHVDADKVIMRGNITMAGSYAQVGNLTKSQNGTAEFTTDGKSVKAILTEIFSKRLQPAITGAPSVSGFALSGAKAVEAGTALSTPAYTAANLNDGSYTYGPEPTGVVASNWKVSRITNLATTQIVNFDGTSLAAGSDNNGGAGFIIGDAGGDNVVNSLKYKVVATHGAGAQALDNLKEPSNPAVAIAAGTKEKTTSAYTPYRNYFYGATVEAPVLDSGYIRGLTKSNKAYTAGTITVNVPAGATRVAIACIAGKTGVTKIVNETALGADVTATFTKTAVNVEGANGYSAKEYNVWYFEPAKAYENPAVLKVTLG